MNQERVHVHLSLLYNLLFNYFYLRDIILFMVAKVW